jgi:hypothetical protein
MLGFLINTVKKICVINGNNWKKQQGNQKQVCGYRINLLNLGSIGGRKNNMAKKLDPKEMVTQKELVYSNMMQIEAKQSRIGLWSQNTPIEPWKYRRTSK